MKKLFNRFSPVYSSNLLSISVDAAANTMGKAGGAIYEVTVWAWMV